MKYNRIEIENWNAVHDIEEHIPFCFTQSQGVEESEACKVILSGVTIGDFSENQTLPQKAVMHEFMDVAGYQVETKSVIPFGAEPSICRKFEYLPNIIKITTDVNIPRNIEADNFEVDSLQISGDWQKFALIDLEKTDKKLKWQQIQPDSTIYESESHFHILLLESADGIRLEIAPGFDLWRWHASMRFNHKTEGAPLVGALSLHDKTVKPVGKFSISNTESGINIRRQVMKAEEAFSIPQKNWRLNWYIAFGNIERPIKKEFKNTEFPSCNQCFHSKQTRNTFRKALRAMINKVDNDTLILKDIEPQICYNSSHVSKAGKEGLEHWDMTDIIDFWFWANKQLITKNSSLNILPPENSIFAECPSFWAMQGGIEEKNHEYRN